MKQIPVIFYALLFVLIPCMASCKGSTEIVKAAIQEEFQRLFKSLQQHDFKKAATYMSPELIKAMHSSDKQMEQLLAANFGNDTFLHIEHKLLSVEMMVPNSVVEQNDKSYAVIHATIKMALVFDLKNEDIKEAEEDMDALKSLVAAMYGDRMEIGEVTHSDGRAVLNIKENRLVAAIYDKATKKATFALSEKMMKSFYDDFLPKEIIDEMEEQL